MFIKSKRVLIFTLIISCILNMSISNILKVSAAGTKSGSNTTGSSPYRGDMNMLDANGAEFSPDYSIVVKKDGTAWEWGGNRFSSTPEDPSVNCRKKPVKVLDGVKVVSAGWKHTLAVKSDGSLWAWGLNRHYQLGTGNTNSSEKPVKIMDGVLTVSAGANYSVALKKDGTLWGWGATDLGQLGIKPKDENDNFRKKPVKLMDGVAAVSAGAYHTMIIKKDGSLWGTGGGKYLTNNGGTTIGNGKEITYYSFTKVMDHVTAVSSGTLISAVIKNDGTLWTWGTGFPNPVKQLDNVTAVSTGDYHVLAIKKDGSLWSWGSNYNGEVGDGTSGLDNMYKESPIKIMDKVISAAAGGYHSFAVKVDGSLWAWGSNYSGELGNGTTENSTVPIKVMEQLSVSTQSASTVPNATVKKAS